MLLTELNRKIDVSTITAENYKTNSSILERYFKVDNRHLNRIHIPQLTPEEYAQEIQRYGVNNVSLQNRKFDTATDYYKRKMAVERLARDLDISVKKLDISTYCWNEDYYVYHCLWDSVNWSENKFMENNTERPDSYTNYIKTDTHQKTLDMELFDELYTFCVKAIRNRKAMLLCKVEQCLSALMNIIEQTNGFSMNTSTTLLDSLKNYKVFFESFKENEDVKNFIKFNSDINIYGLDQATEADYIDTYVSMIRKLTQVTQEDKCNKEYIVNLIHNEYCPFETVIIDKLYDEDVKLHSYIEDLSD